MGAVTIYDVAREAGVSPKTVSNVLNDYPHIRDSTRSKVERAIEALNFRPNSSARNLRRGRTGIISLVLPRLTLPAHAMNANHLIQAAEARDWSVLIEQTHGDRHRELASLRGPLRQVTDGVALTPMALTPADIRALEVDYPLVLLGPQIPGSSVDSVGLDEFAASAVATRHLLQLGRTQMATIGSYWGETEGYRGNRLQAHLAVAAEAGVEQGPEHTFGVADWDRESGAAATNRLLDSGIPFNGLRALNDALALGALRVLRERGLRVPQDVAVIGFDDIEESRHCQPSLSTISPDRAELARITIELLSDQLARTPGREVVSRTIGYTLQARESTTGGGARS